MAQGSNNGEEEDPISNDLPSPSCTAQSTTETETSFVTLPEPLLIEIFCTCPVILLLGLKCLCKLFNKLISDPEFVKKHHMSAKHPHLLVTSDINSSKDDLPALYCSPISSVFSTSSSVTQKLLLLPKEIADESNPFYANVMYSCNGIFCGTTKDDYYFLWNPSINKFKKLRLSKFPRKSVIGFGYDKSIDKYKFVAVSVENKVSVYALGIDTSWRSIQDNPYDCCIDRSKGVFVNGTVNWLANNPPTSSSLVVFSFDLAKESCQMLLLPDFEKGTVWWRLGELNDCLCVLAVSNLFSDVWIMKPYGTTEPWTKYRILNTKMQELSLETYDALYISADDQMLLQCREMESPGNMKLAVYNFETDTLNIREVEKYDMKDPKVYVESLISP